MYKTSKLEISTYISKNKSNLDIKINNLNEKTDLTGIRSLIDNKGSRCTCSMVQAKLMPAA